MTPAEIAQQALDLLERDGWCKKRLIWLTGHGEEYPVGSRCLVGAVLGYTPAFVHETRASQEEMRDFMIAARKVTEEQFPDRQGPDETGWFGTPDVVIFNNHPDTTFDDIRLVLEKVIAG